MDTCAYCGLPATTHDHIPPGGIFPGPRPSSLITVPSCESCNNPRRMVGQTVTNNPTSKDEEYFRTVLATAAADAPAADKLIKQKIIPQLQRKPALLFDMMNTVRRVDVFSPGGIWTSRGNAFEIDRARIQMVISKIVKGLYYHEYKEPLNTVVGDYVLNPYFSEPDTEFIGNIPLKDVEPSVFSYRCIRNKLAKDISAWFLMFYEGFLFFTVTKGREAGESV